MYSSCNGVPGHICRRICRSEGSARLVRLLLLLAVTLAPSALLSRAGHAQPAGTDELRVGVIVSDAINMKRIKADALRDRLGETLTDALLVEVVTDPDAGKRSGMLSCPRRRGCVRKLGQSLRVSQLLFLSPVHIGSRIKIDVVWADVASGRSRERPSLTITDNKSSGAEWDAWAVNLLPDAAQRPPAPSDADKDPDTNADSLLPDPAASDADARGSGRQMTTGTWAVGGIGAAALVAGTGYGVAAVVQYTSMRQRRCHLDVNCEDDIPNLRGNSLTADALFATAAVAGTIAAVLYLTSGRKRRSVPVSVVPTGTGVQVHAGIRF